MCRRRPASPQFPGRFAGSPGAPRSVIGSLRVEY